MIVYFFQEIFLYLVKSPSYWVLLIAASIRNIAGYAIGAWLPTYFVREYEVTSAEFGLPVGFVVLCGGTTGSFFGGFIADRYVKHYVVLVYINTYNICDQIWENRPFCTSEMHFVATYHRYIHTLIKTQ